jgi:protein found in conjugate transposon traM
MKKINFKQPKYIFPAVIFVPLCFLVYFVMETVGAGETDENAVPTDQINASLPASRAEGVKDKLFEMQRRYDGEDEAYTAVGSLGEENIQEDGIDHGYSEDELDRIDAEEAERLRQRKHLEELQRSLAQSRKHINTSSRGGDYGYEDEFDYDFTREMENIQKRSMERQRMVEQTFGLNKQDDEELQLRQRQDSIARAREIEREKNRPALVLKSQETNAERFNTVVSNAGQVDAPLIRAMIDETTKAHEGTRIRFKLLDNVTVKSVRLPKGTYLYGTVTGFGQQRVKATVSSILVGNRFINVSLSVFDNDGMEGFYVPESAFRDFMKEAGGNVVQQNMQFDSGSGYGGISGEAIALQALQNVYNSASSALSANIRKNRAKIKYNTIVYLINSSESR